MLIAKNDEAKRSRIWRIVTTVTSVLIIIIAAFFIVKLFMSNPLEGTWENEDNNLVLSIKSHNAVVVTVPDLSETMEVKLRMKYAIDKDEKIITIKEDEAAIAKAVKASEGQYTEKSLRSSVSPVVTTFGYSVDGRKLTLTEREYGEQTIFNKK